MFEKYQQFIDHDHDFNTFFATTFSAVVSILIGWLLMCVGFFRNQSSWIAVVILTIIPVIVYLAYSGNAEFKAAYYRTWHDKISGRLDRRKILYEFAKKYKIENWHIKPSKIEADGRWNFHANTDYMRELAHHRDLLLGEIHREFVEKIRAQDEKILNAEKELDEANIEYRAATKMQKTTELRLEAAQTPEEIYAERCKLEVNVRRVKDAETYVNEKRYALRQMKDRRKNIIEFFKETIGLVKKIYDDRYSKYTESAIKKINRVNNLKYTVVGMPEPEKNSMNTKI